MDDLKLFRKSVNQIDGVFKFDGIHLPNQEIMEEIDENGYTYLENLELDEIKEHEMKIKATAEYKRRLRLILKSKLNGKNKNQAINTWAVALLKYGAGIINWISWKQWTERKERFWWFMGPFTQRVTSIDYIWNKNMEEEVWLALKCV